MRRIASIAAAAGLTAGLTSLLGPVAAGAGQSPDFGSAGHAVFVQTNDPTGNQVVAYERSAGGHLTPAGRYKTGGDGVALTGAVVDDLASQSSLGYDARAHLLVAVNGGSNTITAFHVDGARLFGARTVDSGGTIPVSVAVGDGAIYVLNAGGAGSVQGFSEWDLAPIPGSSRSLDLTPGVTPQYLNTPGQIGLSPNGRQLVVTTKLNGSDIDVFGVTPWGGLSATPVVNAAASPVPFGFTFDPAGDLVVTEAGTSSLTTYSLTSDGKVTALSSVANGLAALCWVTSAGGRFFYGADAGSATVTGYSIVGGVPTIVGETSTDAGPIDLAASPDGTALFVETGGGDIVDGFTVNRDGSLTPSGSVSPELPGHSGLEGIAVT